DIDLGDNCDAGSVTLRIRHAAAGRRATALILWGRGPRLPACLFSSGLDHCNVTCILDVAQPELDRIDIECSCDLIHERLAREVNLRSHRVAQMGAAQGRSAL